MAPRGIAYPFLLATLAVLLLVSAALAHAQAPRKVAVATRTIARGAVLGANDFEYRDSTIVGALDSARVDTGWVARRLINAGEVLRAPAVEPRALVTANQAVEIEWKDQNVRLTLRGVAARNGALGERVPVRTEHGRRVDATVVAPGRVRLD